MRASAPFSETLHKMLQNPEFAAMYLEEALAEDIETFKDALKDVADAYPGGMTGLSRTTHLNREALYRALSRGGNPNLNTLNKVLNAFGLRVSVTPLAEVVEENVSDGALGLSANGVQAGEALSLPD